MYGAAFSGGPPAVPLLLQPLHEPHAEPALRAQALRPGQAEDGGDAAAQHVLDRGAVPEEGRGRAVPVPLHAHVHIRLRFLPQEEQPVHHLRGEGWGGGGRTVATSQWLLLLQGGKMCTLSQFILTIKW